MKNILAAMLMAICSQYGLAQVPICRTLNEMRQGDVLCKVEVDYVDPGSCGREEVWRMGRITKQSREFLQQIASNGDTIAIFEPDRILHHVVYGDTLFCKGEQQRRAYRIYTQERPLMSYPFQFGDSIAGEYLGHGVDEEIHLSVQGWGYSVADGMGLLTDGEDSLMHITRIHMFDDYSEDYGEQTSIHTLRDHYLWYCAGYRYPVMESIHRSVIQGDTLSIPMDSVSYMYLPVLQSNLCEDALNDSLRAEIALSDAIHKTEANESGPLSSIYASLSSDGMHLNISYSISELRNITFWACDILGNIIGYSRHDNQAAGDWQECLELSRKPVGNALMLNVQCGEQMKSMKVYK